MAKNNSPSPKTVHIDAEPNAIVSADVKIGNIALADIVGGTNIVAGENVVTVAPPKDIPARQRIGELRNRYERLRVEGDAMDRERFEELRDKYDPPG